MPAAETPKDTPPPNAPPAPPQDPSPPPLPTTLQEKMTVFLTVAVALVALVMLSVTFACAGKPAVFPDMQTILTIAVGLLTNVMGFYFGRGPAVQQANQANQAAHAAQTRLDAQQDKTVDALKGQAHAQAQMHALRTVVTQGLDALAAPSAPTFHALTKAVGAAEGEEANGGEKTNGGAAEGDDLRRRIAALRRQVQEL